MRPGREREIGWAMSLALGTGDDPPALEWAHVWSVARAERIANLAWLQSGDRIRRCAPSGVAAAWRRHALAAEAHARQQLVDLDRALDALDRVGVAAVVLKGLPLSLQLYGVPFARVSTDIDLFVPRQERERARAALAECGWSLRSGHPPWDETFEREQGLRRVFLEVHSMLAHDTHAHIPLEPRHTEVVRLGDRTVRTLASPTLPVYLAAHAAIHETPAMLWLVDIDAAWARASEVERAQAWELAGRARLIRHLSWALDAVALLRSAGAGDLAAVRALGFAADGSRSDRPLLRALRLASGPADALRVGGAWVWPRFTRRSMSATAELVSRRFGKAFRRRAAAARSHARVEPAETTTASPQLLPLEREAFLPLLREAVAAGGSMWVRVRGASMAPAVPAGAVVRLCPLAARSLRVGDVVLAVLPSGLPVMHRICRIHGDSIEVRGDALPFADPPVTHANVIAIAEQMRVGDGESPIPARGGRPWRRVRAHWYRRVMDHFSTT